MKSLIRIEIDLLLVRHPLGRIGVCVWERLCVKQSGWCFFFFFILRLFIVRPSVKDLLNHEFFAEESGLKVEVLSRDEVVASCSTRVEFRLRVLDPKKRREAHKENEAIQFEFDVHNDDPDEIAHGMVRFFFLFCLVFVLFFSLDPFHHSFNHRIAIPHERGAGLKRAGLMGAGQGEEEFLNRLNCCSSMEWNGSFSFDPFHHSFNHRITIPH